MNSQHFPYSEPTPLKDRSYEYTSIGRRSCGRVTGGGRSRCECMFAKPRDKFMLILSALQWEFSVRYTKAPERSFRREPFERPVTTTSLRANNPVGEKYIIRVLIRAVKAVRAASYFAAMNCYGLF